MKKLLFILLAWVLFSPAFASESGSYYNTERNGEGLIYQTDGERELWFFFTYGEEICSGEPVVSPSIPAPVCILDGQRFFFGTDGSAYITFGLDYPFAIDGDVSEAQIVGTYDIIRVDDGYALFIDRFGFALERSDVLFSRVWEFPTLLFKASD